MNYIVVGLNGFPSMKMVQSKIEPNVVILRRKNGVWVEVVKDKKPKVVAFDGNFKAEDKVIRWGNTIPLRFNGAKVFNLCSSISNASDKGAARVIMNENHIPIPKTWFYNSPESEWVFPYIARPPKHHGGSEFNIVLNRTDERRLHTVKGNTIINWYFQEIFPKVAEYRIHVAHGKILGINQKVIVEGELRANQAVTEQQWGPMIGWNDYDPKMCKIACDAVKSLGLDMGAVDVMVSTTHPNKIVVAEVNTAPTMSDSEYISERYARYFEWLYKTPDPKWWPYETYTQGKSYAWKKVHFA